MPNIYLSWLVVVRDWSLKQEIDENLIWDTLKYTNSAKNCKNPWSRKRPLTNIFKSQRLKEIIFFLTKTCVFLVYLVEHFSMAKSNQKYFFKIKKNLKTTTTTKKKKTNFAFGISDFFFSDACTGSQKYTDFNS